LHLEVASWREGVIGLSQNKSRILEAGQHSTGMDVVKLPAERPIIFRVIDLKAAVEGNTL